MSTNTLNRWHAEHVQFARLLTVLEGQFALFHDGAAPDYELMLEVMYYMTHYSDAMHHPKEELVFALLREREPAVLPTLDRLTQEHARLKAAGDDLVRALDEIVDGAVASRERIEALARAYVLGLRGHMRLEETDVLPVAGSLLDPRDWAAVEASIARIPDPVFGPDAGKRYALLRRHIETTAAPPAATAGPAT